jgi:hypothetical protein
VADPGFATLISPEVLPDVDIELRLVSWLATPRGVVEPDYSGAGQRRWLGSQELPLLREELLSALEHTETGEERVPFEQALELVRYALSSGTGLAVILPDPTT